MVYVQTKQQQTLYYTSYIMFKQQIKKLLFKASFGITAKVVTVAETMDTPPQHFWQ